MYYLPNVPDSMVIKDFPKENKNKKTRYIFVRDSWESLIEVTDNGS